MHKTCNIKVRLANLKQALIFLISIIIVSGSYYTYQDRKSTRLNSSHDQISYAVFCLKKKKNKVVLDPKNTQNHLYVYSHISANAREIFNDLHGAASGVVDIFHGLNSAI